MAYNRPYNPDELPRYVWPPLHMIRTPVYMFKHTCIYMHTNTTYSLTGSPSRSRKTTPPPHHNTRPTLNRQQITTDDSPPTLQQEASTARTALATTYLPPHLLPDNDPPSSRTERLPSRDPRRVLRRLTVVLIPHFCRCSGQLIKMVRFSIHDTYLPQLLLMG